MKRFRYPSLVSILFEEDEKIDWGQDYVSFVKQLGSNANDPKTIAFIEAGLKDGDKKDDVFSFSNESLAVKNLIPTQNEIDVDKSLAWPMKKPESFISYTAGDGPFEIGSPIITFNGKYIIDGHHRWSQLFACNAEASIKSINISLKNIEPLDALKAVQAAIASQTGNVPTQSVQGTNLLKIGEGELKSWIDDNVKDAFFEAIKENKKSMDSMKAVVDGEDPKEIVKNYIWKNVTVMQKNSQPVPGAPKRDFMPQTDDVNWQEPLKKGKIDIAPPHGNETQKESKKVSSNKVMVERWARLAGIIK